MSDPTAEEWARERLAAGANPDQIARQLIGLGANPAETLKALRATTGMKLEEGRPLIDRALAEGGQEVNDRLRDELASVFEAAEEHLVTSSTGVSYVVARGNGPYACPCCGYLTLQERGGDDICQVCFWHDDGQDDHDADVIRGGPNYELSLSQARANYERIGAVTERVLGFVRAPRRDELPGN